MTFLKTIPELRSWRRAQIQVGFVPTMGALHSGHLKLAEQAVAENTSALVSIFVNPTQFNDANDLKNYPRTLGQDLALLKEVGVHAVFAPDAEEMYRAHESIRVVDPEADKELCGLHRPGHFSGVLTVVLKLLNLTQPTRAYFGEKDFQQLQRIRELVETFFIPCQIVAVPTERNIDGLALSSRNQRLSASEQQNASAIYRALSTAPSSEAAAQELKKLGFDVEYITEKWGRRLAAVRILSKDSGWVRLIDNVEIKSALTASVSEAQL